MKVGAAENRRAGKEERGSLRETAHPQFSYKFKRGVLEIHRMRDYVIDNGTVVATSAAEAGVTRNMLCGQT